MTGGSGFIGTNLVAHHLERGDEVTNFDIVQPRNWQHLGVWRRLDLCDLAATTKALNELRPHVVYHMGARTDLLGNNVAEYSANTTGVANLIRALKGNSSLRLVVFASSMLVCRIGYLPSSEHDYCPNTAYGESKVLGERIVREQAGDAFRWIIVRPTSIWGPWFGAPYQDFFNAVRRGIYVHPKGAKVMRSYGYVGNAVHLLSRLTSTSVESLLGRAVYLADYEPLDLKHWADAIARNFGVARIMELPIPLYRVAAKVGDLMLRVGFRAPPMTTFRLNNMLTQMVHDTAPLQEVCGDLPYGNEDGVRITCEWIRALG